MSDPLPRCCANVRTPGHSMPRYHQCTKPGKVTRDGQAFCGTHDPVAIAERYEKRAPQREQTERNRRAIWASYLRARDAKRKASQ